MVVQRDRAGRAHLHAVLTERAVMEVYPILAVLIKRVGVMVATGHTLVTVNAFGFIPDDPSFQAVNLTARAVGHTTHGDVLARTPIPAASVSFHMRKVNHHIRIVYVSSYIDVFKIVA